LKTLPDASVNCCVTSPPYWGLRDYGVDGQIGLEQTPEAYVAELVAVFREVKRVLRDDGTLWLNLGDSYASGKGTCYNPGGGESSLGKERKGAGAHPLNRGNKSDLTAQGLKPKDLVGIPWRVAFALQADGWYLRQDIIWHKPNPMPESVTDRCTKSHEYIFLLSKSAKYYYDHEAIKEPSTEANWQSRLERASVKSTPTELHAGIRVREGRGGKNAFRGQGSNRDTETGPANREGRDMKDIGIGETRNRRSVWTVCTQPYKEAHFATFPPALITPMILAGCPVDGTVLDPFGGSGTTGEVAESLGRNSILCELNPSYIELQKRRTAQTGLAL
jgi:DNA modification methylase